MSIDGLKVWNWFENVGMSCFLIKLGILDLVLLKHRCG